MAGEIAKLFVTLGLDDSEMKKSLNKLQAGMQQAGKMMAGMGLAIAGSMGLATRQWAAAGDEVQKMALRTGFGTEALSELRHAAQLSGADLGDLEKASRRLSSAITDAGEGMSTYVRSLGRIGLSYERLKGQSPEDQFNAVIEALAGVEDESVRAATAQDLFGRSGTQLLPMLAEGAEGLERMRQEARELGLVFDQEAANAAAAFQDAMTKLKGALAGVGAEIGKNLAPLITDLSAKIVEITKGVKEWAEEHPDLIKNMVAIFAVLGTLMASLGAFLYLLPMIAAAFTVLIGPIGWVMLALTALSVGITALIVNWDKLTDLFASESAKAAKELRRNINEMIDVLNELAETERNNTKEAIEDIRKKYGVLEDTARKENQTLMDQAREASEIRRKEIDDELNMIQRAHSEKLALYQAEYYERIKGINDTADARIKELQKEIKAIDDAAAEERRIAEETRLRNAVLNARSVFERMQAQQALDDWLVDEERRLNRSLLQEEIDQIRESAANDRNQLLEELNQKRKHEDELLKMERERLEKSQVLREEELQETLKRLDDERKAYEQMETDKLNATIYGIKARIDALNTSGSPHEIRTGTEWRIDDPSPPHEIRTDPQLPFGISPGSWIAKFLSGLLSFDGGGVVPGYPGQPVPILAHGGEVVSQPGTGGVTISVSQLVVREEADVQRVARELYRMQQQRV